MPLGKQLIKLGAKHFASMHGTKKAMRYQTAAKRGQYSSAHERLKGSTMRLEGWDRERKVESVLRGSGSHRVVGFTDGTWLETTKDFLHNQAKIIGSGKVVPDKVAQGRGVTVSSAWDRLQENITKFERDKWSDKDVISAHNDYLQQIRLTNASTVKYELVRYKDRLVPMPEDYAKVAVEEGWVTKVKGR